ncbi:uncharacterized protein BT62DRAFT_1008649 [Guyanagaster necrorhizus]|uniref:Uncharacterized protein n=1 Tax=Guyanagaster necrorhizus TaxID=856835 RepID=A0A9P7VNG4_9AGAR|nr:uncharacterized protein BT62DRAFT_1008649 [Guyanagaster necrorhizus MCA 3950]KAG7443964.1 hypothetical protein BT62DRAFT_1008649 [Guyanagaster necrorhizus MCA 3950]
MMFNKTDDDEPVVRPFATGTGLLERCVFGLRYLQRHLSSGWISMKTRCRHRV